MQSIIKQITITIIFIISAAYLFTAALQAQPRQMPIEERVKILKDSLHLSDGQAAGITKILEDQREEITTAMKDNSDDREARRAVMQDIMKKTNDKIKAILSEDQVKKYEEMLKARRGQMGKNMRGSGKP